MTIRSKAPRPFFGRTGISLAAFLACANIAIADSGVVANPGNQNLGAQWQQWALSIPLAVNPQLGADNANPSLDYAAAGKCVIGQRGSVWFLAGTFGGGTVTRTCSVPDNKFLFFPVVNAVNFNTPNVCGQGPENLSVSDLRGFSASFINSVSNLRVELDGVPVRQLRRLKSEVFEIALPESNVFDPLCSPLNVPAGIFSPAVDDGYYVTLDPLKKGPHTLHIHAENSGQGFLLDVTFNLNVIPVLDK
jgi:hypothetical protein